MSGVETRVRVLHSDTESGRFVIAVTEDGQIAYSHWRPFQLIGYTGVSPGDGFSVRLGRDRRDDRTLVVREVLAPCDPPDVALNMVSDSSPAEPGQMMSGQALHEQVQGDHRVTVVSDLCIEGSECPDLVIDGSVVFANCRFKGDFRWLQARVSGGLWFLNCQFNQHFSLKAAVLDESAVLFGCDFSGAGGVSFRGIQACSVLIEFGTRGSDDMLWLNEMVLRGCLALNGKFDAPIQLLAQQDDVPVNKDAKLGNVYIGRQSYRAEQLSRNSFAGGVVLDGYTLAGDLEIHRSHLSALTLRGITAEHIRVNHSEVDQDLVLDHVSANDEERGLAVLDTTIGRHLRMTGEYLRGRCDLTGSSVGASWRLELEHPEGGTPRLILDRFHAEQAWFDPIRLVYGESPLQRMARPPAFGLLAREHLSEQTSDDRRHLAEAYTKFKNWMSDTGHLREEDHAFFHMRHCKETQPWVRWMLGGVFGWGIRLRNVLMSALVITQLFALIYVLLGFRLNEAIMLSMQASISSFFGVWPETPATGVLSIIVTLESMIGVLFVTVLVGAYIRKLLR